jgi:hypothetical protein
MENRIFPAMLANKCAMFNFQDCRFHVRRRKESSGRVVSLLLPLHLFYRLYSSLYKSLHPFHVREREKTSVHVVNPY